MATGVKGPPWDVPNMTASEWQRLHPPSITKQVWDVVTGIARIGLLLWALWAGAVNEHYGAATFAMSILIFDAVMEGNYGRRSMFDPRRKRL